MYSKVLVKEVNPYSKHFTIAFVNLITETKFTIINEPKTIARIEVVFLRAIVLVLYLMLETIININSCVTNLNITQKYKYTSDTISELYESSPYIVVEL